MTVLVSYGIYEHDIEQALVALKKGTQLIKHSRQGKPKIRPFIIFTLVSRRHLCPGKDYISFSIIYNNGERFINLVREGGDFVPINHPFCAALEFSLSFVRRRSSVDSLSDVGSDCANMHPRTCTGGDGFRISVSSSPSSCSRGFGQDDIESLGDVYVWGEVWSDGVAADGSGSIFSVKSDFLIPKPLESSVVLDVHQIACGLRHSALVTRQGEVFTWGEEGGGRLGHGVDKDFSHPRLVDYLGVTNVDYVACGEYHTCAVSTSGDLFCWGDGSYNAGLLGHGTSVSHWIPKRVSGPLEGLQVSSVACGTWHSALTTSNGKLFTFGDGTFGVLGHGNRDSVAFPKEVQISSGKKTIKVACGVWHTAAIVEVTSHPGLNVSSSSSRKLFTWGDGGKNRLGHGNKESYLVPTCVSALVDYNFFQIACGDSLTAALTTSGHVFTMGSPEHGQLGTPQANGVLPSLIQEKLVGEFVEEISCGSHHVALLTSRSEVFTWGRGANGRLGHGDTEDRLSPTLVEALKDRHVKSLSCGSNFTASICIHKWVSGTDQSMCSGCRQAFGFTKKRHNCYNCGLVHCHACSSKKALRAVLAPMPGKPHRVCDSCHAKLKASEAANASKNVMPLTPERSGVKSSRLLMTEPVQTVEIKSVKNGTIWDHFPLATKDITFPISLSVLQNALKPVMLSATSPPQSLPQPASNTRPPSSYIRRPSPPRPTTPVFSRSVIESLKKTNEHLNQEVEKLLNQNKTLKKKCDDLQTFQNNDQEVASMAAQKSSNITASKYVLRNVATQLKEMLEKLSPEICDSEAFKSMLAQLEEFSSPMEANFDHRMEEHVDTFGATDSSLNDECSEVSRDAHKDSSRSHGPSPSNGESSEKFEPGIYVTFTRLANGAKVYKGVRFSKRRFDEKEAEIWLIENSERMLRKYSESMVTRNDNEEATWDHQP